MEIIEFLSKTEFLAVLIPFLVQYYKKKRVCNPEEVRVVFVGLCLIFAVILYFVEKNTELKNSILEVLGIASATYYIIKGFLDYNEKVKNL